MGILSVDPGLVFWTTLSFVILLLILRRYAWKPILRALKVRQEYIEFSLRDADAAKKEIEKIAETQKQMMNSARLEREAMIREARETKNQIVAEASKAAEQAADKILMQARQQIKREQNEAMAGIRQQISRLSLEIAGKILKQEMADEKRQKEVINQYLEDISFN
ncbi:F0F1 ATP synthase subunit B [Geofilum sp. OHC36d9]|uniref:F0F1 ATP synthase subunit B n=1 Tax=Geofilum sp. OHC36d9 TaxID=3458413 RepID=UPI004033E4BE